MTAPNNTERSLVKKMTEIMRKVGYIQKTGYNKEQKYNFVKEEDVLEALRVEMADKCLMIFQELVEKDVEPAGNTKAGAQKFLTTISMKYTIVDGESGEERTISTGGQGVDSGDKGIYKATTGANKYALLKLFMIPTGDDPELDGEKDHQNPQGAPQQSGNQNPYQNKRQQKKSPQQPQNNPFAVIEGLAMQLGYTFEQFMELINASRAQQKAPPVNHFSELDEGWVLAIQGLLQRRVKAKGGQA